VLGITVNIWIITDYTYMMIMIFIENNTVHVGLF